MRGGMNHRATTAAMVAALLLVSGCGLERTTGSEGSTAPEASITLPKATAPVTSSAPLPTTTTTRASTTTTAVPHTPVPRFGSPSWVGIEFSVEPDTGVGFGSEYVVGEPRHAQITVEDEPTGIWIWEANYGMPHLIVVGEARSPYLLTISEDDGDTIAAIAPPDPTARPDLMLWDISGTTRNHWKVADVVLLELTARFLADYDVWGDCFYDSDDTSGPSQRAFGFVDSDLWNLQYDDEGNYIGSDDIRPLMALGKGTGGTIEILDPSLVACRVLY